MKLRSVGFRYFALFAFVAAMLLPARAMGANKLAGSTNYSPMPGLSITTVTELSKSGWLRYSAISVDTAGGGFYVGPFNQGPKMDVPSTVMDTLKSKGLLAAVNGDFFDTGSSMPLSMVVSDGVLIRSPRKDDDFATLCVSGSGSAYIDSFTWSARMFRPDGQALDISSFNELSVGSSDAVLYNALRQDRKFPGDAAVALIKSNAVVAVFRTGIFGSPENKSALSMPFDFEVVATGSRAKWIDGLKPGDKVRMEFNLFPPYPIESAFSGKPVLVRDGLKVRGLTSFTSISGSIKAPRTMAGITWDGRLILVAVEGRNDPFKGLDLDEAAELMIDLGCRDAINLDGGGSTQAAASDGVSAYSLIGMNGAARKVSYSVGVIAKDGNTAYDMPPIIVMPMYGQPYEVQPLDSLHGPAAPFLGIAGELPVITVGARLYFGVEEGAFPYAEVTEGDLASLSGTEGLTVMSEGYIELEARIGGRVLKYAMLAAGEPAGAQVSFVTEADGGKGLAVFTFDRKGRQIPFPAAGIRTVVSGTEAELEFAGPFISSEVLTAAGTVERASVFFGDVQLVSTSLGWTGSEGEEAEVLISAMDDPSGWSLWGSPEGAAKGTEPMVIGGRSSIGLSYAFTGTGVRAAYMKPTSPIPIPASAYELRMDALADFAGGHWLRATLRDASGGRYFLDFGRLAGTGWNSYTAELPEAGGPFSLEQVYLVEFKEELAGEGTVFLAGLVALTRAGETSDHPGTIPAKAADGAKYSPAGACELSTESRLVAEYGVSAVPGNATLLKLDVSGGIAYRNGTGQWERIFEACTSAGKSGVLIIQVTGISQEAAPGTPPLYGMKDRNEADLLAALAQRATFMGYSEVIVVEQGAGEGLAAKEGGILFLAVP